MFVSLIVCVFIAFLVAVPAAKPAQNHGGDAAD
jgi:hypothetical protein